MAIEPVNGSGPLANGATVTITPPAGESWAITNIGTTSSGADADDFLFTTDGAQPAKTGAAARGARSVSSGLLSPRGTILISATSPLKILNDTSTAYGFNYSGVKL